MSIEAGAKVGVVRLVRKLEGVDLI